MMQCHKTNINFVKLCKLQGTYDYDSSNNEELYLLAGLFTDDISFHSGDSYKKWILDPESEAESTSGNRTLLEKREGFVYLSYLYDDSDKPDYLKISVTDLVNTIDEWDEKVIKPHPKFVTLKEVDGKFFIETSNDAMP